MRGGTRIQNTEARTGSPAREEQLSLDQAATHLLEECRMVLPGIQALFGFQMIAVFNQRFADDLSQAEQRMHLAAILLVLVAIILVMAPAAYHRQAEPRSVSETFVRVSSRLLLWSMLPLAVGIALDVFLVSRLVLNHVRTAMAIAALAMAATFVVCRCLASLATTRARSADVRDRSSAPCSTQSS
jgi:hypothetical protein